MSTMLRLVLAALVVVLAGLGGCGGDGDAVTSGQAAAGPIARVEISPAGALFVPGAGGHAFQAKAFDAAGLPVEATFTWTSNAPDVVSVAADGPSAAKATAQRSLGSALITAEAGGVRTSVFAVAAEPAPGAVALRDDQILGLPSAVDAAAAFGPGFRYKVDLVAGASAPVGSVVLATGEKSVAGRVVAIEGNAIIVEQITLDEVFPRLDIRQTLDLAQGGGGTPKLATQSTSAGGLRPLAERDFKIGPLACKAEGALGGLELTKKDVSVQALNGLTYEVAWSDTEKSIVVRGEPKVTFDLETVIKGQLQGKVSCRLLLLDFTIPLPGPLGLFLGAAVPIGVGFEVGATQVLTEAGLAFRGEAGAKLAFGFRCLAGECSAVTEADATGTLIPKWIPPSLDLVDLKIEPEAQVFAWAKLEGGARFSSTLRFDAIDATGGFKLSASFASEETQAKQATYSSSYKLAFATAVGPAGAAEGFLNLVKVAVAILQLKKDFPLGDSPAGLSLAGSPSTFEVGDDVAFTLKLDPAKAKFPFVGYNVESVRLYRKTIRPDGSVSLVLANEVAPQGEQVDFQIPWVATDAGSVPDGFVAFVKTKILDTRMEVASTSGLSLSGQVTTSSGTVFKAIDGYAMVVPPATPPDNPGAAPLAVGKFFFTNTVDGILACAKQERRAGSGYVEVLFAKDAALAPGSYTYAPLDQNGSPEITTGTFFARVVALGAVPTPCAQSASSFTGGTLTLTSASEAGFVGTITLTGPIGSASGTFSIPACAKTYAEHKALSFVCVTGM